MANNRKVLISNLPHGVTSNEITMALFQSQNFKYSAIDFDGSSAIVTLANANEAKRAAKLINGQLFKGLRISVSEAPLVQDATPSLGGSAFVVVGNLSFDFTESQFKELMSQHGEIKNIFLVRGKISKKSKGYGFIEYKNKESATKAKEHFMKTDAKFVDGRIIRVDTVSSSLTVGEAKHSRTLFVDKLPKSFEDEEQLINVFSSVGTVTYCKVARNKQGQPRGYAFVDYSNVIEAEKGQGKLDGTLIGDSKIRVSFCTPGKTAQDIFAKFEEQNNRQSGGSRGQNLVGSRGPRIPNLLPGNMIPLMGNIGGRTGFPQPGPLRTPFGIGGVPGMQRPRIPMDMMRPRAPLLGPSPPGPLLRVPVNQPGRNIRTPRIRTPDVRTMHPNVKPGQGVRKVRPNNRAGLVTVKPKNNAAKNPTNKANELDNKVDEKVRKTTVQAKEETSKDNNQDEVKEQNVTNLPPKSTETENNLVKVKEAANEQPKVNKVENIETKAKEKPNVSTSDSLATIKKISENAPSSAATQSSEDGVKVVMDTEQFKQFQQFQEFLKHQKEAEESGGSKAVSLEDLMAAAKSLKEGESKTSEQTNKPEPSKDSVVSKQPKKEQNLQDSLSKPASMKPSFSSSKLSPASAKPSHSSTKPSHASTKPSPGSTKPSSVVTKPLLTTMKPPPVPIKLSPAIANSSSVPSRRSPVVTKPSSGTSKSTTTSKPSRTTSKPSYAPSRSTQLKEDTRRSEPRRENSSSTTQNSYQRPSEYPQRSQTEQQQSVKSVGSYDRNRNQYDQNSYQDSKPTNTSRNNASSSMSMQPPPNATTAVSLIEKLFGVKTSKTDYGNNERKNTSQVDSRGPHGSSYQSAEKSSSSVAEAARDTTNSGQQSQYGYNQPYHMTDGRDYASKRSPANERENPSPQSNLRSRYTLPERLPQSRGNGETSHTPSPRYETQPERELISYPRPRSELTPRQNFPSARNANPAYGSPQSRGPIESRDSQQDMRSIRDPGMTRNLSSLRDILPPRNDSPSSRDTFPPRDRSPRDYLQRDFPPRDVSPRNPPPRDVPPRDMPRTRDDLPPRDMLLSRGLPPRDDRSARDPYMHDLEIPREREPMHYDSPSRYQSSPASRDVMDNDRYDSFGARDSRSGARDSRSDYPAYGREPEPRYGRDYPSRESAMGNARGPPARYPLEGPQSKRPRY